MEYIILNIPSLFVAKIVITILVMSLLVRYTIIKINEDLLQFLIKKAPHFFIAFIVILIIWFYPSIYNNLYENYHHLGDGVKLIDYIIRAIITVLIIIISIAFSSKLRRTNFKKIFNHILSNDLFYPLLFFSVVFVAEKIIKKGNYILENIHNFLLGKSVATIDWLLLLYTIFVIITCVYYIKKHIKGKGYNFNSNLDKTALIVLLIFPFLTYDIFHFTFEFFPILITTSIYLSLRNYKENRKERLDETLQWNSYKEALKGAKEMTSLNTDNISNFATPRGLRYLTEQFTATQESSISFLVRKFVNESRTISKIQLTKILNPDYNLKDKIDEIIELVENYKIDIDFEHKINQLKIELFKNNNTKFNRFFVVEANTKKELESNDLVNLLSKETDLTDDLRIFNSVYLLHKLFNIDIYLIPNKELIDFIGEAKLINLEKARRINETRRFIATKRLNMKQCKCKRIKRIKECIYFVPTYRFKCFYYKIIYLNNKYLTDAIKNLGINRISKNAGPKKYYRAKPKKDDTFIFEPISNTKEKKLFDSIIEKFKNDDYNLERLIENDKNI